MNVTLFKNLQLSYKDSRQQNESNAVLEMCKYPKDSRQQIESNAVLEMCKYP